MLVVSFLRGCAMSLSLQPSVVNSVSAYLWQQLSPFGGRTLITFTFCVTCMMSSVEMRRATWRASVFIKYRSIGNEGTTDNTFCPRMVRMFSTRVVWNKSFKTVLVLQPSSFLVAIESTGYNAFRYPKGPRRVFYAKSASGGMRSGSARTAGRPFVRHAWRSCTSPAQAVKRTRTSPRQERNARLLSSTTIHYGGRRRPLDPRDILLWRVYPHSLHLSLLCVARPLPCLLNGTNLNPASRQKD